MFTKFLSLRSAKFVAGLGTGLLVGVGMFIGSFATRGVDPAALSAPPIALNATATSASDTMAIATGPISDGVEGLFTLDFLTGDLKCSFINARFGRIGGLYRRNVAADLGVAAGKQPKYLMVTGQLPLRGAVGNTRAADTAVYVCDANSGKWACYILPVNNQAAVIAEMTLFGGGQVRSLAVRPQ